MSGNILVRQSKQVKQTKGSTVHGASKLLVPHSAQALASADFKDFAPYPCICCGCLPSKAQKKRVYSLVYENKLETNNCPCAPWLCCTPEGCINDGISTEYYSHPPFRVGMCPKPCCCIPCTCCGPPVIYVKRPTFCGCVDCRPCYGETVYSSPANCFDLKACLCCGTPCHMMYCSRPLVLNVNNGRLFLSKLKAATQEYHAKHGYAVPGEKSKNVVYREVIDRGDIFCGLCSSTRDIQAWAEPLRAPLSEAMKRDAVTESMEASSATASTLHYSSSSGMEADTAAMMVAAVPVPVPVDSRSNRRSIESEYHVNHKGVQNKSTSAYHPYDSFHEKDGGFDDTAGPYRPQPSQEKYRDSTKQSTNKPRKQERTSQSTSPGRSHQAQRKQREDEGIAPQSYTPQSFDSWGGSSDSFADSGHFGDSMFQGVTLDAGTLDDSGPFAESSTLERSGHADRSALEDSGGLGGPKAMLGTDEIKPRKQKKKSRHGESGGRKSSRPREDGGAGATSRHGEGGGERRKKKSGSSHMSREADYSQGVGVNEMQRE